MPSSSANLSAVIAGCFAKAGLEPLPVETSKKKRFRVLRVKGFFGCMECKGRGWSSHFAWVTVDLHLMRPCKRWLQKCAACKKARAPGIPQAAFKIAVDKLMLKLLETMNDVEFKIDRAVYGTDPDRDHQSSLCEFCGWGRHNCTGLHRPAQPCRGDRGDTDGELAEQMKHLKLQEEQPCAQGEHFMSKWAELQTLRPHLPTNAERQATVTVLQAIRVTFTSKWGTQVQVLEGGSRGKSTDLGCSDLDIVVHVARAANPDPKTFVEGYLQKACKLLKDLRCAGGGALEIRQAPKVGMRAVEFECQCNGHLVKCDVLIGALDDSGHYLKHQPTSIQSTLSREGSFYMSPSYNHLQKSHFKKMPLKFKMLCRMAKLWLKDGAKLDFKCSYMLELVMLKAWNEASRADRSSYQPMFYRFLQILTDLHRARIIFTTFYRKRDVPESLTQAHHIISLSDPTSQTLRKENVMALENAAKNEIARSLVV